MSRDATRPDGSSNDEPEPSSLSALLSPFSYQRRAAAGAEPELSIAADDAVSQARIEPETGAIVLPKLVWPENEPWRAPLPSVEPDFLREVDAKVAREAEAEAAGNGHAPASAPGGAPPEQPQATRPPMPQQEAAEPVFVEQLDHQPLPRRGAPEPVVVPPEPPLPQRPPSPFATRVAEALEAGDRRPLPLRGASPFGPARNAEAAPEPQPPAASLFTPVEERLDQTPATDQPVPPIVQPPFVQPPFAQPPFQPPFAQQPFAQQPFAPASLVQPPEAEAARRALFEPPAPVAQSRPTVGEPKPAPPPIVAPVAGGTPPTAPTPVPALDPGDLPPVFPWQLGRTITDEPQYLTAQETAVMQPASPTSLLPPGPQFDSRPWNDGGGDEPPGPQDGPFADLSGRPPNESEEHRSRVRRWLAIGAGVAVALVVGYGGVAWALSTRIPPETTIAGVAVGGLNHGAAAEKLRASLGGRTGPVRVSVAGAGEQLDPVQAGLTFDPDATISHSFGFTLDPVSLWHRVVGGIQVAPSARTDRGKLTAAMTELAARTRVDPKDATVDFAAGKATLREPVPGRSLDVIAAVDLVDKQWLGAGAPIELPVTEQEPTTSRAEAQDALDRIATPALSGPLVVAVGQDRVSLSPEQFAGTLSIQASEVGVLSLAVNGPRLRETVLAADPGLEHEATDAKILLAGGKPKLVPAVDGITIAPDDLAEAAARALTGTDRTAVLNPAPKAAKFTTAMAQALGIKEQISSWSTPVTSDPNRTQNLRIATKTLNGIIVKPGETFSLNGALGERTEEKGYREAIVISGGQYEKGIGGGVSNVATLVFNNVFFSGLKDITHKPHSFYISRYPVGREATVHWPSVDLQWRNDSPYGVLISAGVDGGRVRMAFWSTKVWDIKSITGPRTNFRAPETVYSSKPKCVEQPASSGFDISVTRVFSKGGQEVKREVFKTSYIAEDKVICGPEPTTTTSPDVVPGDD